MVGKVKMFSNWGLSLHGVDCGSVTIETLLEGGFGFANILDAANSTRDQIDDIGGSASDVTLSLVCELHAVAGDGIGFNNVVAADDASRSTITFEGTMLNGCGVRS